MKPLERSPRTLAADAIEEAGEALRRMPMTREVQALQRRWSALRTVVYGIVIEGVPVLSASQETRVLESAVTFACEVALVRAVER